MKLRLEMFQQLKQTAVRNIKQNCYCININSQWAIIIITVLGMSMIKGLVHPKWKLACVLLTLEPS